MGGFVYMLFPSWKQLVNIGKNPKSNDITVSATITITMPIKLYQDRLSGACRRVLMTIKLIGLDVDINNVDLAQDENLKPQFIMVKFQYFLVHYCQSI